MIRLLVSFWRQPAHRQKSLLHAAYQLSYWSWQLRSRSFSQVIQLAHTKAGKTRREEPAEVPESAREISWAIRVAARSLPWKPTCLPKSLATISMLSNAGLGATLHVSASLAPDDENADFAAHAWVSLAGKPLGEARRDDSWQDIKSFSF